MRAQLRGLDHPFDPPVWDEPHQRHQQVDPENLLPEAQVSTAEEGPSTKALQPPSPTSSRPIGNSHARGWFSIANGSTPCWPSELINAKVWRLSSPPQ